ncbi:serine hydrolase [Liquorilactobacillus cacaonum]|uniref:serine-type D-Ala-D-Ala carboxypeptidase n=1 Tax=Liquorilactobacillus cacaonum DSM 21116 TaxID=1423729 RepID=A0A0R2CKD5_9LACO|nr:serine hydrolase [Liquorilactobacillus cacaonum]KRM92093.1 D-alanyl-d-alanine carboxypeptidase [Liquorilactobacillus cacaonum DSM 21116]
MMVFKRVKKLFLSLVIATTAFTASAGVFNITKVKADSTNVQDLNLNVKSAIAIDATTGQVLYAKNENQALPIASMSKLISVYLVLQAIKEGKLSWNQKVSVDNDSYEVSQNTTLSNVPLLKDHTYTVKQLYQASLIYSANGAVMTLANAVAGSQKAFVDKMRALVKSWGIKDAELYTVSGLDNDQVGNAKYPGASTDAVNKLSASDMALVAEKILKYYPDILKTTSITRMKFNNGTTETEMENWNWMLKGLASSFTELPVDGLKTGTSDTAGADFTGTVHKDGHRIITVVMGAQHTSDTDMSRFVQTQKLMSYVYDNFTYATIAANKAFKKADSLSTYEGKKLTAKIVNKQATHVWLKNGVSANNITAKLTANKKLLKNGGLVAPLAKGRNIGTLSLSVKGQELSYLDGASTLKLAAVNTQKIEKANLFVIMGRAIKNFFSNLF